MIKPIIEGDILLPEKIEQIKNKAFNSRIKMLRKLKQYKGEIVGFDTEYTSKKNNLICFQLHTKNGGCLIEIKPGEELTPQFLFDEAVRLLGYIPEEIMFITYYSGAEVQFLPVLEEGFDIMEYQRGFMDVSFVVDIPDYKKEATIIIFDLCRWFDGKSLASASESFGLKKMKFDTSKVTRSCLKSKKFIKYAKHDAYLCYEIMVQLRNMFMEKTGIDPLIVKTPARASAEAFRNLYVTGEIKNDNNKALFLSMRGTWGGRAEVFQRGCFKGIREYDFKSAYPCSAISFEEMPVQGSWKQVRTRKGIEKSRGGFAKISFEFSNEENLPCLPVHTKAGSMIYPLEGLSFCTFDEVKLAYEMGAGVRIIEAYGYNKGTTILTDYMQMTMEERKKAKGGAKVMYKLLGNALIGKFAQRMKSLPIDEYFRIAEEQDILLEDIIHYDKYTLQLFGAFERISLGSVFRPDWNGLITGRTRADLAFCISQCSPVYCHTDSVWCKKKPKTKWLKIEKKNEGTAKIIRTRFAGLFGKEFHHIAHHSIWDRTTAESMLLDFEGIDFGVYYEKERAIRCKEAMKKNLNVGKRLKGIRIGSTVWDNKRILCQDGDTCPWADVQQYETFYTSMAKKNKILLDSGMIT